MKFNILYLLLLCNSVFGQTQLEFNKSHIECEDKWVFYPVKDSSYTYGFVYIDDQAGPTMQYGGSFKITADGRYRLNESQIKESIKVRLLPNSGPVAIMPESKLSELQLPVRPDWLIHYKSDTTSARHLYRWGFIYNEFGKPELALTFLEKARQTDPNYKGLLSELAYTYNAVEKYERALDITNEIREKTCYDYKELTYALIKLLRLTEADLKCKEAISACDDKNMKAEIAFNMAGAYFEQNDQDHYYTWSKETKKWAEANDMFSVNIKKLDSKMKEK
jgi:tetratricopeptide (TPR) repeat protein